MKVLKVKVIESESVGYRQVMIMFPNGLSKKYFQEFKSTDGWFSLDDGSRASGAVAHFCDQQIAAHRERNAQKLASLEQAVVGAG